MIILVSGLVTDDLGRRGSIGAGKDTFVEGLTDKRPVTRVAFSDPIKRIVRDMYQFRDEQVWGADKSLPDIRYPRDEGAGELFLTSRTAQQFLGTEIGRVLYGDTWAAYLFRVAQALHQGDHYYNARGLGGGLSTCEGIGARDVVVPDWRFKGEAQFMRDNCPKAKMWLITVRVVRHVSRIQATDEQLRHISEQELAEVPDSEFSTVIHNDGTIEDLHGKAQELYKTLKVPSK